MEKRKEEEEEHSFKLMQWNVLCKLFCDLKAFPKVNPECVDWETRKKKLREVFLRENADILCLEEVDQYEQFKNEIIGDGYESVCYKKEEGGQGIALFYKKEIFSLLSTEQVILYKDEEGNLSNQNFGYFFLQINNNKQTLCIVLTHLKAKAEYEITRLAQVKHITNFMDKNEKFLQLYTEYNCNSMIFCGDLNAEPSYSCIDYITNYTFTNNKFDRFISAYNYSDKDKEGFIEMTTCKIRDKPYYRVIDYIFYTEGVEKISTTPIPKKEELGGYSDIGFPSPDMPSDHYYLNIIFKLK